MDGKILTEEYTIVYGAKGVGKSTIVDSVIQGRKGILKIPVTSNTSKEDITRVTAQKTATTTLNPNNGDFVEAMRIGLGDDGIIPTIIFEIERGQGAEQWGYLQSVRSIAEEFSVACTIILVLPKANDVLEFGIDRNRESYIYVEEFTELEALQYLTALGMKSCEVDIKDLINNVGGNPATI